MTESSENKELSTELTQTAAATIYISVTPSCDGVLIISHNSLVLHYNIWTSSTTIIHAK